MTTMRQCRQVSQRFFGRSTLDAQMRQNDLQEPDAILAMSDAPSVDLSSVGKWFQRADVATQYAQPRHERFIGVGDTDTDRSSVAHADRAFAIENTGQIANLLGWEFVNDRTQARSSNWPTSMMSRNEWSRMALEPPQAPICAIDWIGRFTTAAFTETRGNLLRRGHIRRCPSMYRFLIMALQIVDGVVPRMTRDAHRRAAAARTEPDVARRLRTWMMAPSVVTTTLHKLTAAAFALFHGLNIINP